MDALEYIKTRKDICNDNEDNGFISCKNCIFNCNDIVINNDIRGTPCEFLEINYPEIAVEIVENYIKERNCQNE